MSITIKEKSDKAKIKEWIRDSGGSYDILITLLAQYINQNNPVSEVTGENEFQTLRTLHTSQGKVEGVKEFLDQVEKAAE